MPRLLILLLVSILVFIPFNSVSAEPAHLIFSIGESSYQLDGMNVKMDAVPFVQDGRVFVPVRYLAGALGVPEDNITWDPSAHSVTLTKENKTVMLSVGVKKISINDRIDKIDVAPILQNGRVYLPARYVAQAFDYAVSWNESTQSVQIDPSIMAPGAQTSNRPVVNGSPAFVEKTNEALDLLLLKAPSSWDIVAKNLVAIREFDHSGADVTSRTFDIGPATAASDTYWLASTIVHDAYHVQLFLEGRAYSGETAEAEAIQKQRRALEDTGAPAYLIEYLDTTLSQQYWNVEYGDRYW